MLYIIATNTCFWIACPISEIENYNKIYEIKKRDKKKAIAIMVWDFDYFFKYTKLTKKQINFLKNYKNPWTILIDKEKILNKNLLETIDKLDNKEIYKKIAFRVAHTEIQKKLINQKWPLFLTSANKSGNPEIFSVEKIKEEFKDDLWKYNIKILALSGYSINSKKKSSDIFEFIWESEEIRYFRR